MRRNILLLCCAVMVAGCRGDTNKIQRREEKHQTVDTIDEILEEMRREGRDPVVIGLPFKELHDYIETPYRKYDVIVLFGPPDPELECLICQYVFQEFYTVASSFAISRPSPYAENICFVFVDLNEIQEPQVSEMAPSIILFRHINRGFVPESMKYISGLDAEAIARWVNVQTDVHIKIVRKQPLERLLYLSGLSVIIARALAGMGLRWETLMTKRTFATVAVGFCCIMTSGGMWIRIRQPKFFNKYIEFDGKMQTIIDALVLTATSGAVATGMIVIIETRARAFCALPCTSSFRYGKKNPTSSDNVRLLLGLGSVCLFFSATISYYRSKHAYPFHFLLP